MKRTLEPELIDNGSAPEFFANGLHEVDVMGPVSRLTLFVMRRTPEGAPYRETCFTFILPTEAIASAVTMMLEKVGRTSGAPDIKDQRLSH